MRLNIRRRALVPVVLGVVAAVALAATAGAGVGRYANLQLGIANYVTGYVTTLSANVANRALTVINSRTTGTTTSAFYARSYSASAPTVVASNWGGGPGIQVSVGAGKAPIVVNSGAGNATNLSADKLDGLDSGVFANAAVGVVNETTVVPEGEGVAISGVTLTITGRTQWVLVRAHFTGNFDATTAGCPCIYGAELMDEGGNSGGSAVVDTAPAANLPLHAAVTGLFEARVGTHTYSLRVFNAGNDSEAADATLETLDGTVIASTHQGYQAQADGLSASRATRAANVTVKSLLAKLRIKR